MIDESTAAAVYRLIGRRTDDAGRYDVSPGSPVGIALIGTMAGNSVRVTLANGRVRELRALEVVPTPALA